MKQTFLLLICLISAFAVSRSVGEAASTEVEESTTFDEILTVDEAFRFGHTASHEAVSVFWQVQPGYFLYRDKFAFFVDGENLPVALAEGKPFDDETFGQVDVLEGFIEVEMPGVWSEVSVHYQGCAAQGFCYPPQNRIINSGKLRLSPEKSRW